MNLSKKFIFLGLISIFIITSVTMFSFASEEKDYINQAIKLIDEEKYNEAAGELEEAPGFGMYNLRENITFTQGETFYMYGEAKNYTIKKNNEKLFEIYLKEDIYILDEENNILFGQTDFLDYHITSHSKNSDLFINNTITQTSPFPAGNYKFRLVLKDVFSQKTTEVIIDFTVVE